MAHWCTFEHDSLVHRAHSWMTYESGLYMGLIGKYGTHGSLVHRAHSWMPYDRAERCEDDVTSECVNMCVYVCVCMCVCVCVCVYVCVCVCV